MNIDRNENLVDIARTLRKNMTKEERHLWYDFLSKYPVRFRRQEIIGNYIADFYCDKAKLAIELDGSQHYENDTKLRDEERTKEISKQGIHVIRFSNLDVNQRFTAVCEYIDITVKRLLETKGSP